MVVSSPIISKSLVVDKMVSAAVERCVERYNIALLGNLFDRVEVEPSRAWHEEGRTPLH